MLSLRVLGRSIFYIRFYYKLFMRVTQTPAGASLWLRTKLFRTNKPKHIEVSDRIS